MSIRREPIYIQTETFRSLWLIAKAEEKTPDEVADSIITRAIKELHPALIEHRSTINKLEREIIAKLGRGEHDTHFDK